MSEGPPALFCARPCEVTSLTPQGSTHRPLCAEGGSGCGFKKAKQCLLARREPNKIEFCSLPSSWLHMHRCLGLLCSASQCLLLKGSGLQWGEWKLGVLLLSVSCPCLPCSVQPRCAAPFLPSRLCLFDFFRALGKLFFFLSLPTNVLLNTQQ